MFDAPHRNKIFVFSGTRTALPCEIIGTHHWSMWEIKLKIGHQTQIKITSNLGNIETVAMKVFWKEKLRTVIEKLKWCIDYGRSRQPCNHCISMAAVNEGIYKSYEIFQNQSPNFSRTVMGKLISIC